MIRLDQISAALAVIGIEPSVVSAVGSVNHIAKKETLKYVMKEESKEFVEKSAEHYAKA